MESLDASKAWSTAIIVVISFFVFSGCATRIEGRSSGTWILGFVRVETNVRKIGNDRFVMIKSEQAAPVEVGVERFGALAGVGLMSGTSGWVCPGNSTNSLRPPKTFGFRFGKGNMPWRCGLTHYRIPQDNTSATIRVNTVRGLDVKLRTEDPAIRAGYSRSTLVTGESTNRLLKIEFETGTIVPSIEVSEEQ